MVLEGAALADGRVYQDKLAEARRKGLPAAVGNETMAEQHLHDQVHQLSQLVQELQKEKRQAQIHLQNAKQAFQEVLEQSLQTVRDLEQENKQLQQRLTQSLSEAQQSRHELEQAKQELLAAQTRTEVSQQQVWPTAPTAGQSDVSSKLYQIIVLMFAFLLS